MVTNFLILLRRNAIFYFLSNQYFVKKARFMFIVSLFVGVGVARADYLMIVKQAVDKSHPYYSSELNELKTKWNIHSWKLLGSDGLGHYVFKPWDLTHKTVKFLHADAEEEHEWYLLVNSQFLEEANNHDANYIELTWRYHWGGTIISNPLVMLMQDRHLHAQQNVLLLCVGKFRPDDKVAQYNTCGAYGEGKIKSLSALPVLVQVVD